MAYTRPFKAFHKHEDIQAVPCCMLQVLYVACCTVVLQVLHKHEDLHAVKSLQAMATVSYAPTNAPCVSSMRYCGCVSHAAPDVPWYLKSTSYASYALPAFRMTAAAPTELRGTPGTPGFHSIRTLRSAQEPRAMQHGRVQHAASLLVACNTSACGVRRA